MHTQIKGLFVHDKKFIPVDIFGYSTQGMPGIEIIGLGSKGKSIKEKFIYIGKKRSLKIPLRRYVLCVDMQDHYLKKKNIEWEWLELPLLLVFWFLCQHIPIRSFHDCVVCGQITVDGIISSLELPDAALIFVQKELNEKKIYQLKHIGHQNQIDRSFAYSIELADLLSSIPDLNFNKLKF